MFNRHIFESLSPLIGKLKFSRRQPNFLVIALTQERFRGLNLIVRLVEKVRKALTWWFAGIQNEELGASTPLTFPPIRTPETNHKPLSVRS